MEYNFLRYPPTEDRSLQAFNAADDLILKYLEENDLLRKNPIIINDRFGYLSCHLNVLQPQIIGHYRSQEKAIELNFHNNGITLPKILDPFSDVITETELTLIKLPKSLDLFRLFIHSIHNKLQANGIVVCGFMTKYFTPQFISIAEEYFEIAEQTKAWKKSRLLILRNKKELPKIELLDTFSWRNSVYNQYLGVFSAGHIDYATQFFLENLKIDHSDKNILDLASGNGVIAKFIREISPDAQLHLIDDSWLALASSKLNLIDGNNHFHYNDNLDDIDDLSLDLVVSNPPFHFDYEPNIEVTYSLFSQVKQKLKREGRFELVANRHLAYKPFLEKLFNKVEVIAQNNQYIIYRAK